MPELPEVETVRRGLAAQLVGATIERVIVRERRLRWPIPADLAQILTGKRVSAIERRAKYLLIACGNGSLILHLGMSGSLRLTTASEPVQKHDHYDFIFDDGTLLRFTDPRRFGSLHWTCAPPAEHALIKALGCEPLSPDFSADWLYQATRGRKTAIKQFLMDQRHVVGVGNIYANEGLSRAGIHPHAPAHRLGRKRCARLVRAVKHTLKLALKAGGSTLRDYVNASGEAGSFQLNYRVYGRAGEPCRECGAAIRLSRRGQRGTFYCPKCQR
jgi:formamidopyrimidine-DNA glycosylase